MSMPSYAYILHCADGLYYYGSTNDLHRRLARHRAGQVRSTKWRMPVRLVWFEEFETLEQARRREFGFKNGRTRRKRIEHLIATFPPERLTPFA
ncbi:MAG: GIY-YIG nuclease family protein [Planctomycetota bacterium]